MAIFNNSLTITGSNAIINTIMEQNQKPVAQYYYSEKEWDRLGCGPLPEERKKDHFLEARDRGNIKLDKKTIRGYN
jgi:hypothetical protein